MKLSVGQALLILLDLYQDEPEFDQLKRLYLSGAKDTQSLKLIKDYLDANKELINFYLDKYELTRAEVAFDAQTINNDDSRRYFETHLAYETLKQSIKRFSLVDINQYLHWMTHLVPDEFNELWNFVIIDHNGTTNTEREYSYFLSKLENNEIFTNPDFSAEERKKIASVISSCFVAIVLTSDFPGLFPLDIYTEGIYEERGKVNKKMPRNSATQAYGLLKSYSPLPAGDKALMSKPQFFLKPSEQATYNLDAQWIKHNFSQLVHPFSNAISGTLLAQIRIILKMIGKPESVPFSAEQLQGFITSCMSALLFNSGGHTLYEFTGLFELDSVQDAFAHVKGVNQYNLETLFLDTNQEAFDKALMLTIDYNKRYLHLAQTHQDIKQNRALFDIKLVHDEITHLPFSQTCKDNFSLLSQENQDIAYQYAQLAKQLQHIIRNNEVRIAVEYLPQYRQGFARHQMLTENLTQSIELLSLGNLKEAKEIIHNTISTLEAYQKQNSNFFFQATVPELNALLKITKHLDSLDELQRNKQIT